MKYLRLISLLAIAVLIMNIVFAQKMINEKAVQVGGTLMYPSKNIMENVIKSKDHTTLVKAIKAASLDEILKTSGPFTLFAPTNTAFNMLPKGTMESLLKETNKTKLDGILSYHIVSGKFGTKELDIWIKRENGTAELRTISGEKLWVTKKNNKYWIKDEKGGMAQITISNAYQKNGVIHIVDHVMMPK